MGLSKVYRVWVCTGYSYGNPVEESVTPTIISEYLYGDFTSPILAEQKIRELLDYYKLQTPNKQIPQFKITEHIINAEGADIFFQNSESKNAYRDVTSNITLNIP